MNKIIARILIVMGILALSLLSSCPGAGAGGTNPGAGETNPGAGETNPGEGGTNPGEGETNPGEGDTEFEREAATVASTTPAWSSDSSTVTATTANAVNLRAAISGNGPYTLTVPAGVTSIHAVVVGGGGAAYVLGGGAGYIRAGAFTVEAGEELILTVGAGGRPHNSVQDTVDGKASSIKSGTDNIMVAQGGKGFTYNNNNLRSRYAGAGSGGGGAIGANGGYCAAGGDDDGALATIGGQGGNIENHPTRCSSGVCSTGYGGPAADCTDSKSNVKYGAGGGGAKFHDNGNHRGGTGGTATAAGQGGGSSNTHGRSGANHYGSGGGGGARHGTVGTGQGWGGTGVIVLYVD